MRDLLGLVLAMGLVMGTSGCSEAPPSFGGGGKGGPSGDGGAEGDGDSDDEGDGDRGDGDGDSGDGDGDDGDGDGDTLVEGECGSIEKTAELERGPVDIVLALDSSGSMAGGICDTAAQLTNLANSVGASTRVAAVYDMDPLGPAFWTSVNAEVRCGAADPLAATELAKDTARYKHVKAYVDSNDAFQVLLNTFDQYKGFLRAGAPTHFIVVTDDNIKGMTADQFKTQMEQKLGHGFIYHSVAEGAGGCSGNSAEHLKLSDLTAGKKVGICSDFGTAFKDLEEALQASAPLPCDFEIPTPPEGQELDIEEGVRVLYAPPGGSKGEFGKATDAAQCGDKDGWYESGGRIEFCPAACEKVKGGGTVGIGFGCAAAPLL